MAPSGTPLAKGGLPSPSERPVEVAGRAKMASRHASQQDSK